MFLRHGCQAKYLLGEKPGCVVAKTNNQTAPGAHPNPKGFRWRRLLTALAVCVVLWLAIAPHLGSYDPEVLAEGIVLWRGRPVEFAIVRAYPVLRNGKIGEPAPFAPYIDTSDEGRFAIVTGRSWRYRYPAPNQLVVTVRVFDDAIDFSPEECDRILSYEDPSTSPFRVNVEGTGSEFLRIELSSGDIERSAQPKR